MTRDQGLFLMRIIQLKFTEIFLKTVFKMQKNLSQFEFDVF